MLKSQSGTAKVSAGNIVISEIDSNFNSIFRLAGSNGVTMELKKMAEYSRACLGSLMPSFH